MNAVAGLVCLCCLIFSVKDKERIWAVILGLGAFLNLAAAVFISP